MKRQHKCCDVARYVAMTIVMSCGKISIEITLSHTRYLLTLQAMKR
jgi:hypothetical protein